MLGIAPRPEAGLIATSEDEAMLQFEPFDLSSTYLRMRADATVEPLPVDETFWERIAAGQLGAFHDEYLVSCYTFDTAWSVWEMHPKGDEIIYLLSGCATFHLEQNGETRAIELKESGTCLVVPKGTWHTAKARGACRMLFITPGEGTMHREISA
jgi:mannose-6-phosphate isomerase-like protein (cupin superfamily)